MRTIEEFGATHEDVRANLATIAHRALERCQENDTPGFRSLAISLFDEARRAPNPAAMDDAMNRLGDLLRRGGSEDSALRAAAETIERYSKRLEAAKSIEISERNSISVRDVTAMIAGVFAICDKHGQIGRKIATDITNRVVQGSNLDLSA